MGAEDLTVQTDTDLRSVRVWMCASDSWRSKARTIKFKI